MVKAKKSESDSSPKSGTNKSPKQTKESLTKKEVKNGGSAPKKVAKKVTTKGTRSSTSAIIGKFFIAASVLAVVVSAGVYLWLGNWEDGPSIKKLTEYSVSELFDHGFKVMLGGGVTRDEEAAQEYKQGEHLPEKIELQDEKSESDEDEIETDVVSEPRKIFAEESKKSVGEALFEPELVNPQESEGEKDLEKQAEKSRETVEEDANNQQNESQDGAGKFQESATDEFEDKVKFEEITSEFETEDEPKEEVLTKNLEQQLSQKQKHIDESQIESSEKTETDAKFMADESENSEPLEKTFEEKLAQDEEIINKIGDIRASEYYKTIGDTGKDDYKDTVSINNVLHKRHKFLEGEEEDEIETPFEYYNDDEYEEELVTDGEHAVESQDEQIKTDVDSDKRNESESDKVSETEPELEKKSESSDQPIEKLKTEKESQTESATKSEKQIEREFEENKLLEDETGDKFEDKDESETNHKLHVQSDYVTETDDKSDVNETESIYENDVDMEVEEKEFEEVLELEENDEHEQDDVISEETKDSKTKRDGDEEKLKVEEEEVKYQDDEDDFYTNEEDSQIVIETVEEEFGEVKGDQSEAEELEVVQVKDSEDVEVLEETYLDLDQVVIDGEESLEEEDKDNKNIERLEEEKTFDESLENETPSEEGNDKIGQEVKEEEPFTFYDDEVSQVKDEEFVQLQQPEDKQRSEDSKNQEKLGQVEEILGHRHNENESELYDDEKIAKEIDQKIDEALEEMDKQISKNARAAVNHYHVKLLENIKDNFAALGKARALTAVWKSEGLTAILEDAKDTYFLLLGQPPLSRRFSYLATSELVKLLEAKKGTEQEGLIKEALQTLIDMYPDHVDEFNDLALTSLKEGRFKTAKVAFRLVLERHPFDSFARLYLGSLLKIVDRDFQTAVDLMLPVVEGGKANIGDVRIFLELGDALNRLNRKEEAKHVYNKAVDSGLLQSPWQHNIVTVPGLSNRVWWTKEQLSEQNQGLLTELENYWFNVREELEKVLADEGLGALLIQMDDTDHLESGGVEKLHLFVDGKKDHQTCDYLPSTCRMIENIPDVKCKQCQAQIYVIQPNTLLSSFISPSNARIRADLGLSLARDDLILVRGERRSWQLGRFLLYDPSFDREWVIGGDEEEDEELTNNIRSVSLPGNRRALLSLELWHPELSDEQKQSLEDS